MKMLFYVMLQHMKYKSGGGFSRTGTAEIVRMWWWLWIPTQHWFFGTRKVLVKQVVPNRCQKPQVVKQAMTKKILAGKSETLVTYHHCKIDRFRAKYVRINPPGSLLVLSCTFCPIGFDLPLFKCYQHSVDKTGLQAVTLC